MALKIIGEIEDVRTIAKGRKIRELPRLVKVYGSGRWAKKKGSALVELPDASIARAEIHWYEAHGIGPKEYKIKKILPS